MSNVVKNRGSLYFNFFVFSFFNITDFLFELPVQNQFSFDLEPNNERIKHDNTKRCIQCFLQLSNINDVLFAHWENTNFWWRKDLHYFSISFWIINILVQISTEKTCIVDMLIHVQKHWYRIFLTWIQKIKRNVRNSLKSCRCCS